MTPGFCITKGGKSFTVSGRGVAQFDAMLRACLARMQTNHGVSPWSAHRPDAYQQSERPSCSSAGRALSPGLQFVGHANNAVAKLNAISSRTEGTAS